ncbi:MAG: ATP-binding protein [Nitrososphaerales archaeon]
MEAEKKLELHIPNAFGYEKVAMNFAASAAKDMGLSDERIEDLKTSVSEACLNAIEHGNKMDASMKVGVILDVEEMNLHVTVQDAGDEIGPVETPNIDDKVEGRSGRRGWGIFLIKNLVDELKFENTPEGGNLVRMIIYLEKQ